MNQRRDDSALKESEATRWKRDDAAVEGIRGNKVAARQLGVEQTRGICTNQKQEGGSETTRQLNESEAGRRQRDNSAFERIRSRKAAARQLGI